MGPTIYIIAGCNGAGKTTASFTILPEILGVHEFVNADEIARGLSPFQPEKVAFEAGRIMLNRMDELIEKKVDFAFETTLATRSYLSKIKIAREQGYRVILVFFWLDSFDLAIERVKLRVSEGGHNIKEDIIRRRYTRGLENLFGLYLKNVDEWMVIDNSQEKHELMASGIEGSDRYISNWRKWTSFVAEYGTGE
ncbi:MAG: zeta toxin [Roseivirga sp.]|nr:zeta toxin [Roseivirga sp.]